MPSCCWSRLLHCQAAVPPFSCTFPAVHHLLCGEIRRVRANCSDGTVRRTPPLHAFRPSPERPALHPADQTLAGTIGSHRPILSYENTRTASRILPKYCITSLYHYGAIWYFFNQQQVKFALQTLSTAESRRRGRHRKRTQRKTRIRNTGFGSCGFGCRVTGIAGGETPPLTLTACHGLADRSAGATNTPPLGASLPSHPGKVAEPICTTSGDSPSRFATASSAPRPAAIGDSQCPFAAPHRDATRPPGDRCGRRTRFTIRGREPVVQDTCPWNGPEMCPAKRSATQPMARGR